MCSKKGFTIIELVIVIAVVAILAAVLLPTFTFIIDGANRSTELEEAMTAMNLISMTEDGNLDGTYYVVAPNYLFEYDADDGLVDKKPKNYKDAKTTRDAVIDKCLEKQPDGKNVVYYAKSAADAKAILGSKYVEGTSVVIENEDITDKLLIIGFKAE